jgi:hypothetical protein
VLPVLLLALGLAIVAELLVAIRRGPDETAPPLLSWLLFAWAAGLFVYATWPVPGLLLTAAPSVLTMWKALPRPWWVLVPIALSLVSALASVPLFMAINTNTGTTPAEPANTGTWVLWIASLLLFGLGAVQWERQVPSGSKESAAQKTPAPGWGEEQLLPRNIEWAIIAGLFVGALVLRLVNLESTPPGLWFDEAQNGLVAQRLLEPGAAHPTFIGSFTQMGAFYFYILGIVLKLFGATVWPLRLLPALAGAALAPLLYLLGARLYGWQTGLAAGGLVALSAWNLTFSRFGIASLPTVALDVAFFLCVVQGMRTGRLGYYAGAGVLLGLALQQYYVARLVPFVLGAVLVHIVVTQRKRAVQALSMGIVTLVIGAMLAFLPVGLFAIQQPQAFSGRVEQVSIFSPQVNKGDPDALTTNLSKHLLMFNFRGDGNGRHNFPNAPMLDDITVTLFFLGFGVCMLRAWRWQYFFPVVWFVAALSGGVLSLPFEAPQSHRTLENSVVTALIAGIALGDVARVLSRFRKSSGFAKVQASTSARLPTRKRVSKAPTLPALGTGVVLAALVWVGSLTLPRYFGPQATALGIWEDMNAPQAAAASALRDNASRYHIYISPAYVDSPANQYLAPGAPAEEWPGMSALPFASADRDVMLLLDPASVGDLSYLRRLYPHTSVDDLRTPTGEGPMLYTVRISAADIAGAHGVEAETLDATGAKVGEERTLTSAVFNWDGSVPSGPGARGIRLSTTVRAESYGSYLFHWRPTRETNNLRVDGYEIVPGQAITLSIGLHSVVATDTLGSAAGAARLEWTQPNNPRGPIPPTNLFDPRRVEPHGLTGSYWTGSQPSGPPQLERVDQIISFSFDRVPPGMNRPYNVQWAGRLYVPEAGTYQLGTEQITSSILSVDGEQIIVNDQQNSLLEAPVDLSAGWHDIRLEYVDRQLYSHVFLYWTPPRRPHSLIPAAFLWPILGEYPVSPKSGAWPTLADSDPNQPPSR